VVEVGLDRPAVLTPLLPLAAALVASFGTSNDALVDAIVREDPPEGRLPFDLHGRWNRCADTTRTCRASTTRSSPTATARSSEE